MTTYFFDSYVPIRLARMLRVFDVSVFHQLEPQAHGSNALATTDSAWVGLVRARGYTLITVDRVNRKDTPIPVALELRDITVVFLPTAFERIGKWEQASWLLKTWEAIDAHSRESDRGTWARVSFSGHVEVIDKDRNTSTE